MSKGQRTKSSDHTRLGGGLVLLGSVSTCLHTQAIVLGLYRSLVEVEVEVKSLVSEPSTPPCVGEALWRTCFKGVIEGLVQMRGIGTNILIMYHVIGLEV